MATSVSSVWFELRDRLNNLRSRYRKVTLWRGILITASVFIGLVLLTAGLEGWFRFTPPGRFLLVTAGLIVTLGVLIRTCLIPLWQKISDDMLAKRIDRHYPDLNDRVTMTLQLWRQQGAAQQSASPELLEAAFTASAASTENIDFEVADGRSRLPLAARIFGGNIAIAAIVFLLFSVPLSGALNRLTNPLTHFPAPQNTFLTVQPGHIDVATGGQVTVTADIAGEMPDQATIRLYAGEEIWKSVDLSPIGPFAFSYTIRDIHESINYEIEAGDARSPRFRISVIDRPRVASMHLTYRYPPYTRLAPRTTTEGGDIVALKGTRVAFDVKASQALATAQIEIEGQENPIGLQVEGDAAEGALAISTDQIYRVILRNRDGRESLDPPQYRITVLPDRMPDVRIVSPGKDANLTENMLVSLLIAATDDFGFSSMNLVYQKAPDGEIGRKALTIDKNVTTLTTPYVWDVSDLGLFPEDIMSYYVELFDNDTVTGPKRAVSRTFTLRFPSIAEIYEELDEVQDQQVTDIEEMLKDQEEAQKKLEALNRELEKKQQEEALTGEKQELSWEEKKDLEAVMEQQEKMADDLMKAAEAMEQAMEQLEQQDMQSMELAEKMNQLRQLFQEIATPELMEAMQELKKAMKNTDNQMLKESLEDFEMEQEAMMKRLERSLSILKRMQAEQKMMAAVRKSEDLHERQEELQYATENSKQDETEATKESLSEKQQDLKKATEALQKDLEELAKSMEDIGNMPSDDINKAAESMEQQQLAQKMDQISQQMQQGQMSQAAQGQQQASEALSDVSQQLQQIQEQMQNEQMQEVATEMRQAMHQLVDLSQNQEALNDRTNQSSGRNSRMQDLAEDQQSLMKGAAQVADQLVATSQKSFFISPEIGQALGETLNRMQSAGNDLTGRNRSTASQQQMEAMEALNESVLALQQAMNNMNASGSASGMMEMMQQLQSMAQQQSGLNEQMEQMNAKGQGKGGESGEKMSLEERAKMARLAAEQEALRKSLEQLQKEKNQQSQLLGRLNEIEREMEETVRALQQNQVDPQIMERQQRILSRLLDASRSMRERDQNNKREARPGEDLANRPSPDALPSELLEFDQALRNDILRSVRDGAYPQEYEELIRAYFRALSDAPREN